MKIKFKRLDYQEKCLNQILGVFKGIYLRESENDAQRISNPVFEIGVVKDLLLENIENLRSEQKITHGSVGVEKSLNCDILMETGTGKTFCFLECVYALHKNYHLSKFIVLAPSNAIKLGVLKSVEITREFFKSEYSTHLESYEDVERFILASNHKCCMLVMTFSAFNKEKNTINQSCLENTNLFNGAKSYMQALASMRPIVILDEPHRFLGDKTKKYLEQLNALITLRFGATFKDDYNNLIYALDSKKAFDCALVKSISVASVGESDECFLELKGIEKRNEYEAAINYTDLENKTQSVKVKEHDNLGVLTQIGALEDYIVEKITKTEIRFLNGFNLLLDQKEPFSHLLEGEQEVMLKEAIKSHFEREEGLFKKGIKALCMVFISGVNSYLSENEKPAKLALLFEKLNGYKEGSFYTPSFITSYMCKESISQVVLDKFNQKYNIECKKLEELKNYLKNDSYKEDKRKEYLQFLLTLRVCDPAVGSGHFLVSALNEMVWVAYELGLIVSLHRYDLKLENDEIIIHYTPTGEIFNYTKPHSENDPHHHIQKELFELKKSIIENCLFGVDINPNSCEITKLRLWIELLKYSYYIFEEGKNTNALETLPNIDINIKCANSLISRFNLNDDLKKIPNIKKKIQEYKDLVAQYKDPNPLYPLNKVDLINKIQDLKNTFSLTLKDPKTKAELEKAIEKHIKNYNFFALDDKSLLAGLNYFIPNLFGTLKLSPKEEEEAFASYGRIRALRKKLDDALSGGEYQNAFEWRFEFPEVLDDEGDFLGFDCIIGNPPYMQVKKGLYSSIFYPFSEGKDIGKQNTYKVFIELGFNLTKQKGLISLITQSSIMCDYSAQFTRELLLKYCQIHYFVEFNKKQKLFSNVIQGVCILEFLKDRPIKEHAFKIAINNTQNQMNQIQYEQIKQDEILKFFPLYEIPLIKSGEMEIIRKIKTDKISLRDLLEKSLQGNINTIHLKDIQDQKETNGRIYKGANCHRYFLDTQYLFAKDNQITQQIFEKNYYQNIIVTQNITGTSDAYRIHANLIEVKDQEMLFLDTCNLSYCKEREHAKFLVGLLNSRLLDWLFRKTSTNNHVNLYELETLPIPQITEKNQELARKITDGAEQILKVKEKDPKANTLESEKEIDALVYQLYNLTDEEIKTIEDGQ
ncbi:hypothetical protein HpNP132_09980 [Helicobacter pylori]